MLKKFRNKYRIPSNRLQNWDYGWNAPYFVTVCTAHRVCYFGDITDNVRDARFCVSTLSEIGKIAWQYWSEIPKHFPFVTLDAFVIMPNHVHGIILIEKPYDGVNGGFIDYGNSIPNNQPNAVCAVETQNLASLQIPSPTSLPIPSQIPSPTPSPINKFGPQSQNLPSIIRGFKSAVTINARKINSDFAWQPRYYEHIIRDEKSYTRIRDYIRENPENWFDDDFHE